MSQNEDSGCGVLFAVGALLAFGAWYLNDDSDQPPPIIATPVDPVMSADNLVGTPAPVPEPKPVMEQAAPPERPRWDFIEGQEYGYLGAVSEEDRKRGVAAGTVHLFRYAGEEDGKHVLISLSDNGTPYARSYCSSPCVAIKMVFNDGSVRRIAYDTSSVIGAAFEDATAGRLKAYVSPRQARRTPEPAPEPGPVEEQVAPADEEPARLD